MAAPLPSATTKWHSTTYPSLSPTRPELSAKGKWVLISGGGTGIGGETARYFAEAGAARIALLGRREQPLLENKALIEKKYPGTEVFIASTDVTDESQVDAAFAKFAGDGKIDVLVSSAGMMGPAESIRQVDPNMFVDGIAQNVKGALFFARACFRHAAPEGVVVNVSSAAAHLTFAPAHASYTVAKLAAYRLWDLFAFQNPNLSVFHIQPGVVDTEMNRQAGGVAAVGWTDDGESGVRHGRSNHADWHIVSLPASFSLWLASPEARFLKGKFLWVNWDVDELKAQAEELESSTKLNVGLGGWPFQDAGFKGVELKNNFV